MACLRLPLLATVAALLAAAALGVRAHPLARNKRQAEAEAEADSESYVADYAGNMNDDGPAARFQQNDMTEDKFAQDLDEPPPERARPDDVTDDDVSTEERPKAKKKSKKHKYLKKTFDFLKKVLDPDKLMQNAYVTEMLRRFSEDQHDHKTQESKSSEEVHTPPPVVTKKRRGRPRKKDRLPTGITGIIKKGVMSLTQLELDRRKLRRRYRMIKRIARKAKRPLKTAVKIFLNSRNQGMGGGYGGYGNNENNY